MSSLLGLKFLKAKSKEPKIKPPHLQENSEEKASASGNKKKQKAAEKKSVGGGGGVEQIKFVAYAPPSDFLETITEKSEEHQVCRRSRREDAVGVSNTKKASSSHSRVQKSLPPSSHTPVNRKNFASVKNLWQDETFTNNESLPAMEMAYRQFKRLYPEYLDTCIVDEIRAKEYPYLTESGHVCLDYSGYGLFSKGKETWHEPSASFGLSYISVNLPTHALYGGADEGTVEHDIKIRVLDFLNIQESEYAVVFTASRGSAFKLLGESYPFHLNKKLLSVYDYESDAMNRLEEAAQKKGAEIINACFRWPSQRMWATDLKKKLLEKKKSKREPGKGLFVFPVQSRVTGAKYSYQWMSQAQENGWDILLDASALGPNAMGSLGLSVFRPDFIVSSFFKVYGSDPTGFGCLLIKRSAIQRLHSSSAARGVGVVRLVPKTSFLPEKPLKGGDTRETEIVVADSARFTDRRHNLGSSGILMGLSQKICMADGSPLATETSPSATGKQGRLGHGPVFTVSSASPSKPHGMRGPEALSSNSRIVGHNHLAKSFREPELELVDAEEEDEISSEQSRWSVGLDGSRGSEGSSSRFWQQRQSYVQPSASSSATTIDGQQCDPSFVYSEGVSSAFFLDDDDYDDGSVPFDGEDDDGNGKSFLITRKEPEIECRGLDHAHKLGLIATNTRLRCLINWLIASMLKLYHPGSSDSHRLVQIYGPRVDYDRGVSVAFNLTDWRGNLLQPLLVQRLADRNNISFGVTTLKHIHVPKRSARWPSYLQHLNSSSVRRGPKDEGRLGGKSPSFDAITVAICFLSNFEDVYRFWVFLANFLDADFVSKEVWRYRSLNQETVVLGVEDLRKS